MNEKIKQTETDNYYTCGTASLPQVKKVTVTDGHGNLCHYNRCRLYLSYLGRSSTDYAALMTPPPASAEALAASVSSAGAAATGRFYFRKKTLSYSIVANERFGFPKLLTFLDQGRIVLK